ncbi:MAG TPA: hypothetical protein VG204_04545 [Terriglobia bacterium]|nr:hypothetical protein [Terriglobia bacterium]
MGNAGTVRLGKKLLFSALAGVVVSGGCLIVLGWGILEDWWRVPPALSVSYLLGAVFMGSFLIVLIYLLLITYYTESGDDMI